ncbi:MAG: hypothetical protein N3A54_04980, partial [Patescibacteria group bacterium]|nr:hypothetical protein [Patescibacteria group bacterium]
VLNYQQQPFDIFSWKKIGNSQEFHEHYYAYKNLSKIAGKPKQRESYAILSNPFPEKLVAGSDYSFFLDIKNQGQAIISAETHIISIDDPSKSFGISVQPLPTLEPDQTTRQQIKLKTPKEPSVYSITIRLEGKNRSFDLLQHTFIIIPPPSLRIQAQLGWRKTSNADQASVLIYDGENILYEFKNLPLKNGEIVTPGVLNITPHANYRIVTLIPYYLPRQTIQTIEDPVTIVKHKRFLPLDTNRNNQFDIGDIQKLLQEKPAIVLSRFFGR